VKINVFNATGQLGKKVIYALMKQGAKAENLFASVRTPEKAADFEKMGVNVRKADYEDQNLMTKAFEGVDVLLLIPSKADVEARILQFNSAISAAKKAGVGRIVFSSLSSALPHSKFIVSTFLLYAESKLRLSGIDWTIVRNNLYLDPIADWIPELIEMKRLPYPVKNGKSYNGFNCNQCCRFCIMYNRRGKNG